MAVNSAGGKRWRRSQRGVWSTCFAIIRSLSACQVDPDGAKTKATLRPTYVENCLGNWRRRWRQKTVLRVGDKTVLGAGPKKRGFAWAPKTDIRVRWFSFRAGDKLRRRK